VTWPDTSLIVEATLELDADLTADPNGYAFATDITTKTFDRNGDSSITIRRGRQDEQTQSAPSTMTVAVNNTDGRFSPRNPTGAYYGGLRRNTPLRVRVNPGTGLATRGVGFASEFPLRWDVSEADHHVPIVANGILRRLGQGQTPLKSALYRTYSNQDMLAYWPMEDESPTTTLVSGLSGGTPIRSGFELTLVTGQAGTDRALELVAASFGYVFAGFNLPTTDAFQLEFVFASDRAADTSVLQILCCTDPTITFTIDMAAATCDGDPHHIALRFTQNGANVDLTVYKDGVLTGTTPLVGVLKASVAVYLLHGVYTTDSVTVCHLAAFSSAEMTVPTSRAGAADGYDGELAAVRFARLCDEEFIPNDVASTSSEAMGPQTSKTLLELLRECEAADEGLIVERRTGELGFDTRISRENQTVALTLDYSTGQVSPPLEPTDDDQRIRNDVTVTREGGSSGRFVDEDGPLGVTAVGRYDEGVTLNLFTDDQALQHASYRVGVGTVDLLRFPTVTMNLRRNDDLVATWLALDIGSRIQITNLPDIISYDDLDLIVEGYTEQISQKNWIVTFNCAPYGPYQAGVYAEDSMSLLTAETTATTSWRIGCEPDFTEDTDDLPVDLRSDGEVVSVTAVAAVAPSILAGTPAHADNASVTPTNPSHLEGDLMLVLGAIRNSGTGTVSDLSGYTSLYTFGNMRIFGKYATSAAMADPTVSFAGGAAGDTTSAVVVRARGCQITVLNSKEQLNGSAQDISFPHYVQEGDVQVIQFCWKQDDYTSVAPSTYTEVVEASTTTGNDQSLYVVRGVVSTDSTPTAASSHTVTGGAAAISRVVFLTLPRGVADLTVTRSVNGVSTTHAQLADVQVDKPLVWAL
jgi:hypothetical protein